MSVQIFHGDVLYSKDKDTLVSYKDSYIVVKDGLVDEIFEELPEQYKNLPINDYGKGVIIPSFPTYMYTPANTPKEALAWTAFCGIGLMITHSRRRPNLRIENMPKRCMTPL